MLILALVACEENPSTFLQAPGGGGSCFSDFDLIQVVGDFTTPAWTVNASPVMVLAGSEDCAWSTTVRFETTGEHIFKFVTGGAFDNPEDFGGDEEIILEVGVENAVQKGVTGPGTAVKLNIPTAGCYEIRLFEDRERFIAREVSCSSGGVRGQLVFENVANAPFPRANVSILLNGVVIASDSSAAEDGTFLVSGVDPGTFDVEARAFGFLSATKTGVEVGEAVVDAGVLNLLEGCVSAFDNIQVVGEITTPNWDLSVSPQMRQVSGCVWQVEIPVNEGTSSFKLVTNDAFDGDYGGDESTVFDIDSDVPVSIVSGDGTAIIVRFPFTGTYTFTLDEQAQTLRVDPGNIPGDLKGILVFDGITSQPFPKSNIRVLDGAQEIATAVSAAEDGSFLVEGIAQGLYDVEIVSPIQSGASETDSFWYKALLQGVGIGGGTKNLGQVFLLRETVTCALFPDLFAMRIGGEVVGGAPGDTTFSWFQPKMKLMDRSALCGWSAIVEARFARDYRVKFITNTNFVDGNPPAFGGDDTTLLPPDSTVVVVADPIPGIANGIIIRFETTGFYTFHLDLTTLGFWYERTGDLPDEGRAMSRSRRPSRGSALAK